MIEQITEEIYKHVLGQTELNVHYQPIVSISKRKMIGFESLLRTCYHEEFINPESLFHYARMEDKAFRLDEICRSKAIEAYLCTDQSRLIFINMESSLLDYYTEKISAITGYMDSLKMPRGKIVIEINEKRTENNADLINFVNAYRNAGFLIALDDVGAGYSNLNRIILVKPDIIKVDRSVIHHIYHNYYKHEVLESITNLAQKIGALTIAEGAEEDLEVISCVSCGVDWFQGYYFSKAMATELMEKLDFSERCRTISHRYQQKALEEMTDLSEMVSKRKQLFYRLLSFVNDTETCSLEKQIRLFMQKNSEIECIYLIDENGMQITDTLFHKDSKFKNKEMFSPMHKGDFHISKPFFHFALQKKERIYVSAQYLSLATGNLCQTLSKCVLAQGKINYIVCADFILSE